MADWQTVTSETVYETPWIKVHRDDVRNQNSTLLTYSYMETKKQSVFVVPVNAAGEILLQSVYRYTFKRRFWEIPAGYIELGEDPLAAGKRELTEETGFISDDWHMLGTFHQILGTGRVTCNAVLARNVHPASQATDADEDITQRHFASLSTIEHMIKSGELVDCPVITALYMAKIHGIVK